MKKYYPILKWLILIAACAYLAYALWQFVQSGEAGVLWEQWKCSFAKNLWWLAAVFALLPLNWLAESRKWQLLIQAEEPISLKASLRSVLGGASVAFFTPNRVGEFPARSMFLQKGNRTKGIILGFIGSFSQTLVIIACGVPALWVYFSEARYAVQPGYLCSVLASFFVIAVLYLFLPAFCKKIRNRSSLIKIEKYLAAISQLRVAVLGQVLFVSALRYAVFCTQFFCMLRFCEVELSLWQGAVGIAVNYLFITFTPSVGFSEGVVRSSAATLVLQAFSANTAGIAAAGVSIWAVNFVLPMMIGSMFLVKK